MPSQHFFIKSGVNGRSDGFTVKVYRHGGAEAGLTSIIFAAKDSRPGAIKAAYRIDPNITINDWNHFIFTYKFNDPANLSSHFTAYFNGIPEILVNVNTWGIVDSTMGTNILLSGQQTTGAGSQLSVDDVALFNGVLTPSQAAALYQMYS